MTQEIEPRRPPAFVGRKAQWTVIAGCGGWFGPQRRARRESRRPKKRAQQVGCGRSFPTSIEGLCPDFKSGWGRQYGEIRLCVIGAAKEALGADRPRGRGA